MQFKTPRIEAEYATLAMRNFRLYNLLERASTFVEEAFGKPLILTCIYRSEEENKALYAPKPQPEWRPHTKWEGVDLRSSIYTEAEIEKLLNHLNMNTVYGGRRKCAVYHKISGNAYHLHIQCPPAEVGAV